VFRTARPAAAPEFRLPDSQQGVFALPFTLSHAAAVLPALRRDGGARGPLVASALVLGTFSPDITYFAASVVPGAMAFGRFTHSVPGVLTVDVAVTALLVAAWVLIRDPLVALLPEGERGRVHALLRGRRAVRGPGRVWWFWVSAVLGASSHMVWDAFTHHGRWGVELLPFLEGSAGGFHGHQFAQYGSSLLGGVLVVLFLAGAVRRQPRRPVPASVPRLGRRERLRVLVLLGCAVAAGAVLRCVVRYGLQELPFSLRDLVPTVAFGSGTGLVAGVLVYGVVMRRRRAEVPEPV
jgi:hypothetical protein